VSGAGWFLAGWLSAAIFIGVAEWIQHRRRAGWLEAADSEQFASGCQRFTEAGGI